MLEDISSDSCQISSTGNSAASTKSTKNIIRCLQGREWGCSWPIVCSSGAYAGRSKEKWIPFLEGWKSLGRQFEGHAVLFGRRSYSSWVPTWCAYTSSAAVAQPFGRTDQSVQKVLDVRFHPEGLAQLVCSSNEAPNELLLYNLLSGKAVQLSGHNCQIQAVEFAVRGASIASCGGNLMKVWDATTGSCLFTLGPVVDDRASAGHTKKISAMTVNSYQSCLVVTSGGLGDGKLLLWNALTGELTADLNVNIRSKNDDFPSIEAMEFYSQNLLVCGSDSAYGGPAVLQLWDIESPQSYLSIPANDSYITSLKTNPDCNTIITGAGDGAVDLYDIRTSGVISHLSVGSRYEVTSVSFSTCGTYFHASSTSNCTLVWDTRLMPMNRGQIYVEKSSPANDLHSMRPLHCLIHGKQMPTAEHAGQLPGHVDEGDQGVNDAKWLQREPVLVTVSGDGSIAMWDVNLGQPCMRHLISHTRCVNTVAVAPNDEYLCSGGDDQKVVLYCNTNGMVRAKWRLSHPLTEVA
uniref:Putative WD repeat-containing protein alr3466 n=1 Tax=Anthurium amnicola TaxID=1678845 RepID=A0A1D1XIR9_9ARAE